MVTVGVGDDYCLNLLGSNPILSILSRSIAESAPVSNNIDLSGVLMKEEKPHEGVRSSLS